MGVWSHIFAAGYDHMMTGPEKATLRTHRESLIPQATGRVLEIGGGTGANLPFYARVETLTLTEPDKPMVRRLERRLREEGSSGARLLRAPAEDLPFEDESFDAAVSTLVLCTVDDQPRALRELRRVLKPGGRLLFIEHVRAEDQRLARWQDRLNALQTRLGHGCHCNRPTIDTIRAAGFEITQFERDELRKAPPIVKPLVIGIAQANGHHA